MPGALIHLYHLLSCVDRDHALDKRFRQRRESYLLGLERFDTAAELLCQAVNGAREVADLSRRRERRSARELTRRERLRHVPKLHYGTRNRPGEQPGEEERHYQSNGCRQQHVPPRTPE